MKVIFKNILKALGVICYFAILVYATTRMDIGRLSEDIKIFAGAFLVIGILILEKAYKEDSGKVAITAIEFLVLSIHSLSITHMVNLFKCEFKKYLFISGAVILIYYIIKGIILYTKENQQYLKDLSDISDIVKEDEPVKKEAHKRNKKEEIEKADTEQVENKKEKSTKTKKPVTTKKSTKKNTVKIDDTAEIKEEQETKESVAKKTTRKPTTKKTTKKTTTVEKSTTDKKTEKKEETKKSTRTKKTVSTGTSKTPKKKPANRTKKEEVKEND